MDNVTEAAAVLLSDLATFYAVKNGGAISITEILEEMHQLQSEAGDDWSNATAKMIPLMAELFTAFAADAPIDMLKTINDHKRRIDGRTI